ncbi:MAG: polymorphic toxin-type HINT domain-containing protein [Nanoarchaeota archaeon]
MKKIISILMIVLLASFASAWNWVPIGSLKPGNVLMDKDGNEIVIETIEEAYDPEGVTVYDLEVKDYHYYYAQGALVHNSQTDLTFGGLYSADHISSIAGNADAIRAEINKLDTTDSGTTVGTDVHNARTYLQNMLAEAERYRLQSPYGNPNGLQGTLSEEEPQYTLLSSHETQSLNSPVCFLSGTMITLAHSTKPIEDIRPGDKVLTYDFDNGKTVVSEVVDTYQRLTNKYLVINNKIKVTPDHIFYIEGQWVPIGEAQIGDKMVDNKGNYVTIESIEKIAVPEGVKVYNFKVKGYPYYYAEGILVHNEYETVKIGDINFQVTRNADTNAITGFTGGEYNGGPMDQATLDQMQAYSGTGYTTDTSSDTITIRNSDNKQVFSTSSSGTTTATINGQSTDVIPRTTTVNSFEQVPIDSNNDGKIDDEDKGKMSRPRPSTTTVIHTNVVKGGDNAGDHHFTGTERTQYHYNLRGVQTYSDTANYNAKGEMTSYTYKNNGGGEWTTVNGNMPSGAPQSAKTAWSQAQWRNRMASFESWFTAYQGFSGYSSLLWDEEDTWVQNWKDDVNDFFCSTVIGGGVDCFTSAVCSSGIDDSDIPANVAFVTTPNGLTMTAAHVEAEMSGPLTSIDETGAEYTEYLYKITYVVNNMQGSGYDDLKVYLQLTGGRTYTFPQETIEEGKMVRHTGANAIVDYSYYRYTTACLYFDKELSSVSDFEPFGSNSKMTSICTPIAQSNAPASSGTSSGSSSSAASSAAPAAPACTVVTDCDI